MKATLPVVGLGFVAMSALSASAQPAPGPAPTTSATAWMLGSLSFTRLLTPQ